MSRLHNVLASLYAQVIANTKLVIYIITDWHIFANDYKARIGTKLCILHIVPVISYEFSLFFITSSRCQSVLHNKNNENSYDSTLLCRS